MFRLALCFLLVASHAMAQTAVQTQPAPRTSLNGNFSGTVTAANVFQMVLAKSDKRAGCDIQNNGTTTLWVSEGKTAATSTEATSYEVAAGGSFFCERGQVVLTGEIDVTGAAGQAFYAVQY